MFCYVAAANKPTSVFHSVVGNLTSPHDLNLIISKGTRIEIYLVNDDILQAVYDVGVYGRIATMFMFRPKGEQQDFLFLSTERYKFCVLSYDTQKGEIKTRANGDLSDRIGHPADVGQIGIIDAECRVIVLHLYGGMLKVIPLDSQGRLQEAYNVRIEELMVVDMKFLYDSPQPTIALLYQDTKEARHVKTYEFALNHKDIREGPWNLPNVEASAEFLITLPLTFGGLLVVGEQSIIYHNGDSSFYSLAMKPTIMKAYGFIDSTGERIMLGDHLGRIYVLILENTKHRITGLKLEPVGQTSCPSTLAYLHKGLVFVGSCFGDSELIKLQTEKDETGQYIEHLEAYSNLGPITDFCVVDLDRQGQSQIVTCSGAYKDGSLRIIRNGIGINEHAQLDLPGIKGIWSLQPPSSSPFEKYLVMSFVGETRVLSMRGEDLEEVEMSGLQFKEQTIFCGNVLDNHYLQVTTHGVYLVNSVEETLSSSWIPDNLETINVCACNTRQVLLSTAGTNLILLEIVDSSVLFVGYHKMKHEIACLNINPVGDGATKARMCAVGQWNDICVKILALPGFEEIRSIPIEGEMIPRSVLFSTFGGITYLMIALGDGHLISYIYDLNTGELQGRKQVSVGTQPVTLNLFTSKGQDNIFACSNRPTVIYHSNNKKLLYSNVNLKEVSYMCDFNCPSFPDSLALSTGNSLTIGTIDEIQKLHIQTIPLGEMARRIQYHPQLKSYCVTTLKSKWDDNGEEQEEHWIRLFNDQTFEIQDSYCLQPNEDSCSIMTTCFHPMTPSKDNYDKKFYFVVGTAYVLPNEDEPTKGRILVFSVIDNKLRLEAETTVRGAVYSIKDFNGKILAGVNSKIQLFKWTETEDSVRELTNECEHVGHILVLYLDTRGDFILVGDLMKSITLLVYSPVDSVIKEVARDYSRNWMTSVCMIDDDNFIGAENSYNLFTLRKNSDSISQEERERLVITGEYHLGELVNCIRHGSLVMKMPEGEGLNIPTLLFGTVNGVIGVVGILNHEQYTLFLRLQDCLNKVIKGVGGFLHSEWRCFSNERKTCPSKGLIDGNMIESFLELSDEQMTVVAKEMDISVEELVKIVENICRATH
eukprot:TRINITY_DN3014_c0_g1_i10.p1 TRINITY_DN3014_c0_g1~~TRINITY_DN3014_c0_g1_i10.p1  ORF type:complete len:1099 (-),score=193.96 TRINITY_DN3014_c0_g1_i10:112-3408(-)